MQFSLLWAKRTALLFTYASIFIAWYFLSDDRIGFGFLLVGAAVFFYFMSTNPTVLLAKSIKDIDANVPKIKNKYMLFISLAFLFLSLMLE
jgi:hypothetical protein